MKIRLIAVLCAVLVGFGISARAEDGAHRLGGGVNYWTAIDDIDTDNIDEDGFSYVLSYQYRPGLLGLGVDVEMQPDILGEDAFAGQIYGIVGSWIYGAVGVGMVYWNDELLDTPFISLRAGLDLELLPSLHLDIYGQYRFESSRELDEVKEDIDTDTIFLGVAVRLEL